MVVVQNHFRNTILIPEQKGVTFPLSCFIRALLHLAMFSLASSIRKQSLGMDFAITYHCLLLHRERSFTRAILYVPFWCM